MIFLPFLALSAVYAIPTTNYKSITSLGNSPVFLDMSVSPKDDLYHHVNNHYLKTEVIPGDKTDTSNYDIVGDIVDLRIRQIVENAAAGESETEKMVGMYQIS
jgi:predicted metalloendopeptidase